MGVPSDDAVLIEKGKKAGEPYAITVNCPDNTGLGCDICRTFLDFGLYIIRGDKEARSQALSSEVKKLKKANVMIDNSLSPACTLLQINCIDHKGFLYDILRTLKDCNIQIAFGRFSPVNKGHRELDLFIRQKDGRKILDAEKQEALYSRLKVEMLHPLRVLHKISVLPKDEDILR
ncbi:hypothetical protein RJ639_034127 [Escallonia herrerae]|uniref:ACT domain-containing protein ACR n=1 Tax=Escallonia herrerae TaxID=1293975 RepID=A0AA88WTS6_9ASTE|nr:hypothetical protein RJ639_034127 [Escallonia herrerae]